MMLLVSISITAEQLNEDCGRGGEDRRVELNKNKLDAYTNPKSTSPASFFVRVAKK